MLDCEEEDVDDNNNHQVQIHFVDANANEDGDLAARGIGRLGEEARELGVDAYHC